MTAKVIIQRIPCELHPDRVAAICHKCHELAEREREMQWVKERKAAHQEYLRREQHRTRLHSPA